jgi:hypothetical protein
VAQEVSHGGDGGGKGVSLNPKDVVNAVERRQKCSANGAWRRLWTTFTASELDLWGIPRVLTTPVTQNLSQNLQLVFLKVNPQEDNISLLSSSRDQSSVRFSGVCLRHASLRTICSS